MDVIYHNIFFTIFTGPECISQTFYTMCKLLLFEQTLVMKRTIYVICIITELKVIYFRRKDRSISLAHGARVSKNTCPSPMPFCATLPRAQSIRTTLICQTFGCAIGCDWSIRNGAGLNGSVYCFLIDTTRHCYLNEKYKTVRSFLSWFTGLTMTSLAQACGPVLIPSPETP